MTKKQEIQEIARETLINDINNLTEWVKKINPKVKTSKDTALKLALYNMNLAALQSLEELTK